MKSSKQQNFNIKAALGRLNNKPQLYLSILGKFVDSNQSIATEIRKTYDDKDYDTAKRLIHTLKGVSGNIGADKLNELTKVVEHSIESKEDEKVSDGLVLLGKQVAELISSIQSSLGMNEEKEDIEVDNSKIKELLPQLKDLLKAKSPKAKKTIIALEEAGLKNEIFDGIKKAVSSYNFKKALELIDQLSV
jgi:two-component system sensor histidine kinase/response regulator